MRKFVEWFYYLALCAVNNVVMYIPNACIRRLFCRALGMKMGGGAANCPWGFT